MKTARGNFKQYKDSETEYFGLFNQEQEQRASGNKVGKIGRGHAIQIIIW